MFERLYLKYLKAKHVIDVAKYNKNTNNGIYIPDTERRRLGENLKEIKKWEKLLE